MINKKLGQVSYKICKYTFFNICKGDQVKKDEVFLTFVTLLLLIFGKGDKETTDPGFCEGL